MNIYEKILIFASVIVIAAAIVLRNQTGLVVGVGVLLAVWFGFVREDE